MLHLITVGLYLTFAVMLAFLLKGRAYRNRANRPILGLLTVFILCAVVGYVSAVVAVPHAFLMGAHIALNVAMFILLASGGTRVIATQLNGDD